MDAPIRTAAPPLPNTTIADATAGAITTIEGNVKGHTVKMYVRDYDLNKASDKKQKPKDMTLVPKEERDREETNIFSYGYAYTKKNMYITIFLMPWIPEESQESTEE